ncbi:MAG: helix-turn-helix domain-containing protein, partial [Acidobacteriota bacterium]
DLYYRLQVVELRVPPLRERLEDLPALVEFFLDLHAARLQRDRPRVSESALAALSAQAWKGNVRELANAVERAVLLADEDELGPSDFGLGPAEGTEAGGAAPSEAATGDLKEAARAAAAQAERRLITEALEETGGNVTRAAERLGLSRRGLQLKMKQLDLR